MRTLTASLTTALVLAALAPRATAQYDDFDTWTGFDVALSNEARFLSAMELGDLDNDGHEDVAVVSEHFAYHALIVLINHGDQTFGSPRRWMLQAGSRDLTLADLDGDGDLDVALTEGEVSGSGTTVALWANDGAGAFTLQQRLTVGAGPQGIAAGDFDGDGDPDLAVAMTGRLGGGRTVEILTNDGRGGFERSASVPVALAPFRIEAGDLDEDGRDDLAIVHEGAAILTLLRATEGSFGATVFDLAASFGSGASPCVDLVDLDLDGDLDVAFSDSAHFKNVPFQRAVVTTVLNQGGGAFALGPDIVNQVRADPFVDMEFADMNGDGWPDVLGIENHLDWSYVLSDGAGGWQAPSEENWGYLAGDDPVAVGAIDADHDGDLDAMVLNRDSLDLSVHRFEGGAVRRAPWFAGPDGDVDVADLDGDGDLDLAGGGLGPVIVVKNAGDGTFGPPSYYNSGAFGGPRGVKLRDMDGDGLPDVLLGTLDGFNIDVNRGSGEFGAPRSFSLGACGGRTLDAADLDNDGDLDVVLPELLGCPSVPSRRVFLARNEGGLAFTVTQFSTSAGSTSLAIEDLDGDGNLDLVLGQPTWLDVHLGNGDLTFSGAIQVPVDFSPRAIVAADLDGDGALDLASANYGDANDDGIEESLTVVLGNGDGTFGPATTSSASWSWDLGGATSLAGGDVDADGDVDLMLGNYGSGDVSLYRNRGDGTFLPQSRLGGLSGITDVLFVDVTGDGLDDLVVSGSPRSTGSSSQNVAVLHGLGGDPWIDLGSSTPGTLGAPYLDGDGPLVPGGRVEYQLYRSRPGTIGFHVVGRRRLDLPLLGGVLVPDTLRVFRFVTDSRGEASISFTAPPTLPPGISLYLQDLLVDPAAPQGWAFSNAVFARGR